MVFVCLLSFSIGVISGKGWSDRDYRVKYIEQDSNVKLAQDDEQEVLDDEISEKEVELLTQKALAEAKALDPNLEMMKETIELASNDDLEKAEIPVGAKSTTVKSDRKTASLDSVKGATSSAQKNSQMALESKPQRSLSSLPPRPTLPKPSLIEYTVQVAAYKTINEAESHSQKLIDKGFPAFPVKAMIDGQEWYRVSIGSFKNKAQAMNYEKSLKKQAMVKSTFVQKITRAQEQ